MKIGITDNYKSEKKLSYYTNWIRRVNPTAEMVKLSYLRNNAEIAEQVDGLLLTGGGDVNPACYGKGEQVVQCRGIDDKRDEFELDIIKRALDAELPILAICRGMQIMNVYLDGSLIIDLPSSGYKDHSSKNDKDVIHQATSVAGSLFREITGQAELTINSSHHQALDRLGKGLIASATSPDNVIEAAEWADKKKLPFLLMVQYHPERMNDFENPASKNIAERFLKEVIQSINNPVITHSTE
ncbi:MAG: gamma-glutamyl-gamma-aminobutyrate hydrolase family protein [Ignavibacteriales bacterium]|nr:gamma-glutamyl-gamma-aminobutyrate hydrolase family protein [Ignavibacteriales bacterium]